ncbi:MAG TPA: hypothetical protein VMY42_26275 [Thermoguttaceae bacterium]|nr:hypothetical protein [Thermoguttaceae bacterium]
MDLSDKDRKRLWAKAANRCSYRFGNEVCDQPLVLNDQGTDVVVGNECHIVGDKPGSARYVAECTNRNSYENAILLCPVHHKVIDDGKRIYTVDMLQRMKREHEGAVTFHGNNQAERLSIVNSEFSTEVSGADRAVGMEVNRLASLSGVKSTLKAENVKEAIGFSTNQGLTGRLSSCPYCGQLVPAAYTGPPPQSVKCLHCGRDVPMK